MRCNTVYLMVIVLTAAVYRATHAATIGATKVQHDAVETDKAFKASAAVQLKLLPVAARNSSDAHEQATALDAAASATPATKTTSVAAAAKTAKPSKSLGIYNAVHGLWNWLRYDVGESLLGDDDDDVIGTSLAGRTFGKIRRLQMALIPIMFKFGVLSAMIAFLVIVSMKTLFLVKVLLFMNAAAILSKFITLKANFGGVEQHAVAPAHYSGWNPTGWSSASPSVAPSKEIHLHIHGGQLQSQGASSSAYSAYGHGSQNHWERRNDPYAAYEHLAINDVNTENELSPVSPINVIPTAKYASNHRSY